MSVSNADGTRGRILVVEDDPEAALFAVHVLANRGGFKVTHTADPAAALRLAAAEHWDLLLTDQDMPGMSGLELLDALRTVAPGLPVALVSAHAPVTIGAVQADKYLEKPLRVDQLIATAAALIGRGRRPLGTARVTITCGRGDRYRQRQRQTGSGEPGLSSPARARGSAGRWPAGWPRRAPGWWSTTWTPGPRPRWPARSAGTRCPATRPASRACTRSPPPPRAPGRDRHLLLQRRHRGRHRPGHTGPGLAAGLGGQRPGPRAGVP